MSPALTGGFFTMSHRGSLYGRMQGIKFFAPLFSIFSTVRYFGYLLRHNKLPQTYFHHSIIISEIQTHYSGDGFMLLHRV